MLASLDDAIAGTVINTGGISDNIAQRVDPGTWLLVARGVYGPGVAAVPIIVGSTDISMPVQLRRGGRLIRPVITDGRPPPTAAVDIQTPAGEAALGGMPGAGAG